MKRFATLGFALLLTLSAWAQAPGAGANYEKSFWNYIEKLKTSDIAVNKAAFTNNLNQAKYNLNKLKTAAPDYDVSKHQAAFDQYQAIADQAGADKKRDSELAALDREFTETEALGDKMHQESIDNLKAMMAAFKQKYPDQDLSAFDQRLDKMSGGIGSQNYVENNNKFHSEFRMYFDKLVKWRVPEKETFTKADFQAADAHYAQMRSNLMSFANSPTGQLGKSFKSPKECPDWAKVENSLLALDDEINNARKAFTSETEDQRMVFSYYEIYFRKVYWEALATIFPQSPAIADGYGRVQAILSECGPIESWMANQADHRMAQIKSRRLKPANCTDEDLEAEFKAMVNKMGWGKEVIKVNLWNCEWHNHYNEINGALMFRTRFALVVTTSPEKGICTIHEVGLQQDYIGGSFQPSKSARTYDLSYEIMCENVH